MTPSDASKINLTFLAAVITAVFLRSIELASGSVNLFDAIRETVYFVAMYGVLLLALHQSFGLTPQERWLQ